MTNPFKARTRIDRTDYSDGPAARTPGERAIRLRWLGSIVAASWARLGPKEL